jgi:drug/metabolite transporter (DMT)-like permease
MAITVLVAVILDQRPTLIQLAGAVLVGCGVLVVARAEGE